MSRKTLQAVQYRFTKNQLLLGERPDLMVLKQDAVAQLLKEWEYVEFWEGVVVSHASGDGVVGIIRCKVAQAIR